MKPRVISAIVNRELASYFSSPTGYVFITIFIFLSAFAAFWLPDFFARNLASLDTLNRWFPALLLLLVPAITMAGWAEERKLGTDELLLTLPARDGQLVLGKYLACLLIYSVALLFSLSHVAVLSYLGRPDAGLMLSTYFGYWLAGAALIAVGLVASALTSNLTIAFIVAAVACGLVIGIGAAESIFPGSAIGRAASSLSLPERMLDFGRGVIAMDNVAYFVLLALLALWLNTLLVSRRHWAGARDSGRKVGLAGIRAGAFVVAGIALVTLLARTGARADATAERLWSLSPETLALVEKVDPDKPVLISAYLSPKVPESYTQTRETLIGLLRELDAAGGGRRIAVRIVDTEPFTEAAREAKANFNIEPRPLPPGPEDPQGPREIFMGLAFTSGPEQFVIPFLHRGLPVEYELARSIRTVTLTDRKKVGILETEVGVYGAFDFQTFTPREDWPIVEELKKQYEVVRVNKGSAPPADLDALIVPQPSTLTDAELVFVIEAIRGGLPTIVLEDPLPLVNPGLATSEPRGAGQNPFQQRRPPQQDPKADLRPLFDLLGAEVPATRVIWDAFNPRPQIGFEREIIFVARDNGSRRALNDASPISSGLQEVVLLLSGEVRQPEGAAARRGSLVFTPLMSTGSVSGFVNYSEVLQRSFLGIGGFNRSRRQVATSGEHVLAAHITGTPAAAPAQPGAEGATPAQPTPTPINVVLIADLDMVSPEFFRLRETGVEQFNFDNVTFILNAVDVLTGEQSLVELRKRRPAYRTLTRLDEARRTLEIEKDKAVKSATDQAEDELARARDNLNKKVSEIEQRADLDETTRGIMIESVRQAEQRRLDVLSAAINDQKEARITEARTEAQQSISRVQDRIRLAAVLLPPIPALALAGIVFMRRRAQELEGVSRERLRGPGSGHAIPKARHS